MDWYRGRYMHPKEWVPWMEGAERNYRNVQSTICHVSSCLLWDFALTPQAQILHGSEAEQLKNTFNSKSNMNLFLELIGDCRTYEEQCFFYFLF